MDGRSFRSKDLAMTTVIRREVISMKIQSVAAISHAIMQRGHSRGLRTPRS